MTSKFAPVLKTLLLPLMKDAYNLSRWLMKNQEDAEDADLVRLLEHGLQIVEEAPVF